MNRNIENFPQLGPENGPENTGDKPEDHIVSIPSEDDSMELGIGLSIGETDSLTDLKDRIARQILDSQTDDRGKIPDYEIERVDARLEGKDIVLSVICKGQEPMEFKFPYAR